MDWVGKNKVPAKAANRVKMREVFVIFIAAILLHEPDPRRFKMIFGLWVRLCVRCPGKKIA